MTAKVSSRAPALRLALRKDLAVHVSLSSYSIVKQQLSKTARQYGTRPFGAKRPLPGLAVGWLSARETREKQSRPPLSGGGAVDGRVIGPARSDCQQGISKKLHDPCRRSKTLRFSNMIAEKLSARAQLEGGVWGFAR